MKRTLKTVTAKGIAAVSAVLMCISAASCSCTPNGTETSAESESESAVESTVQVIADTETEKEDSKYSKGLKFESNGDGTCTLTGIGSCTDKYVTVPSLSDDGELVTAIGDGAFSGASSVKYVQIPASVDTVGQGVFENCPALAEIAVEEGNHSLHSDNGVLYSYDLTVIYAYPAAKSESSVVIPVSVREIKAMAFYGCKNLNTVKYAGSASEWKAVKIGEKNYTLESVTVEFSKGK